MPAAAIIGGAVSLIGGIFGSSRARREARRREIQARGLEYKLNQLEENIAAFDLTLSEKTLSAVDQVIKTYPAPF